MPRANRFLLHTAASGHPLISGSKNYGRTGDKIKKSSEKRVCGDAR